jgi:hypothetical protein
MSTRTKRDLMLEVLMTLPRSPGECRTYREIAAVLGISWQAVWQAEQRAILKMAREAQRRGLL